MWIERLLEARQGDTRAEVAALCTAGHDTSVTCRSRLDRARWNGLMGWMVGRHGMPPRHAPLQATVVDYLARNFGPGRATPRGRNPFLDRPTSSASDRRSRR